MKRKKMHSKLILVNLLMKKMVLKIGLFFGRTLTHLPCFRGSWMSTFLLLGIPTSLLHINTSLLLMDIDGLRVVVYIYELIDGEVKVDKIDFKKTATTNSSHLRQRCSLFWT